MYVYIVRLKEKEKHEIVTIQSDACNHGVVEKWSSSRNIWRFEAENGQIFSHFSHPCLGRCTFQLEFPVKIVTFFSLFSHKIDSFTYIDRFLRNVGIIKRTYIRSSRLPRCNFAATSLNFASAHLCPTYYANSFLSGTGNGELHDELALKLLSFCSVKSPHFSRILSRRQQLLQLRDEVGQRVEIFKIFFYASLLLSYLSPLDFKSSRIVIVFELSQAGCWCEHAGSWFRIFLTRNYLDDPFGIFKMVCQPGCLHLVCTWQRRKFRKFSAGTRFAPDSKKFFR